MEKDLEYWFGRGSGDPDVFGYPGQEEPINIIHATPKVYQEKHWSKVVRNPHGTETIFNPRIVGDNDPASPEEAGY